jgi:multiple sugar transport system substrate-binding protein
MTSKHSMSRRGFLRAASFTSLGLALAACAAPAPASPQAGSATSAGSAVAPAAEQVTVTFHARIGQQEDTLYDMQMPKFMDENPNITIAKESFPGAEYNAKLATMQAGGTLGDVVWSALGGATIQFSWANNVIAPIDDLVASQNVDLSEWYEGCINAITVEGNLLGLPFKAHPGLAVVYYNQSAMEEAGIEPPDASWTMDDHVEIAKALTKEEGGRIAQYGYLPDVGWKSFVTGLRAFGGQLINEDGTQFQLTSEEGMQFVNYTYDYFQTHKVAPSPEAMMGTAQEMWIAGALATWQAGTSGSVSHKAIDGRFEWMAVSNPVGPGGVGGSDYEVDAYCITTTTTHPNEGFEWVKYLCNRDSGVQLGLIGGTVGGRPDVYGAEELLVFPFRHVFKDVMDNAMASRITANWRQQEAESSFTQLMQPLWNGEEQPTDAFVASVSEQIQEIMDKPRP